MPNKKVLILAGGTGGHVYPALAVAQCLTQQGVELTWLGLQEKIEYTVAQQCAIPFHPLQGTGVRGVRFLGKLCGLWRMLVDCWHLYFWLRTSAPDAAIGFGGYSSFAAGVACFLRRVPLVIQEQNAIAGTSNKLLARLANHICLGYHGALPDTKKTQVTGNPVRQELRNITRDLGQGPLCILVLGGSLGAWSINQAVAGACAEMNFVHGVHIVHQCGRSHEETTRALYDSADQRDGVDIELYPFLDPIVDYYARADLVICRAGAMTLAELAACGLPALLVPYPYAIDDHQTANARAFTATGSGWLLEDGMCTSENIQQWLQPWMNQSPDDARQKISQLAQGLGSIAYPQAADTIASLVIKEGVVSGRR